MSHWFDRFCESRAQQSEEKQLSRRSFLFGLTSAIAATSLTRSESAGARPLGRLPWTGGQTVPDRLQRPTNPRLTDQCARAWSGDEFTQSVAMTDSGITYQRQLTYNRATNIAVTATTVKLGDALVISTNTSVNVAGAANVTINYGPAVGGVRTAVLSSPDGKLFNGTVDDRAVRAEKPANGAISVEFLDHRPPSSVTADPAIGTVFNLVVHKARIKANSCVTVGPMLTRGGTIRALGYKPGTNGPNDPGDGWYVPGGTYNAPNCDRCWDNCVETAWDASGLSSWITYASVIGLAYAEAAFPIIAMACWGTCQLPGGGCCPVPCGGPFVCCGRDDQCFQGNLCCPSNMVVCNNVCCGPNISTCAPDGSCGCPTGLLDCEQQCCGSGEICCGGQCCVSTSCRNNSCCTPPSYHCGDHCCPPFSSCCNGQCCSQICVNNVCCPPERACGAVCCSDGQVCSNGTCFGCGRSSGIFSRLRSIPCHSLLANGTTVGVCCSAISPTCCGGVCCSPGQNYCTLSNGQYVCTDIDPHPIR